VSLVQSTAQACAGGGGGHVGGIAMAGGLAVGVQRGRPAGHRSVKVGVGQG
jgi:hypothetical protein